MKIINEYTGEEHKNVEEALKAEAEYRQKLADKKAQKEKLAAARKERAAEIEAAMEDVRKAKEHYQELLEAFCKDYGSYHYSTTSAKTFPFTFWF